MKRKRAREVFAPIKEVLKYIFEAKVTIWLIGANIFFFIFSILVLGEKGILALANHPQDIFNFKWYTLITSGFLHAGVGHLLGNMLALFAFGRIVEKKLGSVKMLIIYFGALIISGVFTSLIHHFVMRDNIPGIGASGALMGIIATAILLAPFYITYEALIPLPVMVLGWLAIWADITGVINPTEDGIGHFAHIGGFISIAALAYLFGVDERSKLKRGFMINIASLAVALIFFYFLQLKKII